MILKKIKNLVFLTSIVLLLGATQESTLLEGYYINGTEKVEIILKDSGEPGEKIILKFWLEKEVIPGVEFIKKSVSEDFVFVMKDKNYQNKLGTSLIISQDRKSFKIIDNNNNDLSNFYTFSGGPGWFKKLITLLVASALLFSFFQFYLKLNKVWKRRKILEVANSISIVASLLGFATLVPFLLNSLLITGDYASAAKYILGIILATVFTFISVGYFVDENRGLGFFTLLGRALKSEGKESGDLLSDMLRPKGARKIIEILEKLAAIDDDIAQEEIDLIKQFSDKWGIQVPDLKPGKPENVTNLVELKALVQSYLDEGPDTDVAEGLVDLINLMAEADDEVTEEEAMAVAEFTGMIAHYVSSEKGGDIEMYEVNIVPQGDEQMDAVHQLLPELDIVKDRGGQVFKVGKYFSEDYAEAVCKKYISLGLYSGTTKIKVDTEFAKV